MGWTSTDARFYTADGKVNRKAECDALYTWEGEKTKNEVIKSSMRGSVYYAAVRTTDKTTGHSEVFAAVCLTSTRRDRGFNFGYKGMAEDMGPCEDDCPKGILVLLTDTESKYAKEWRERCWAKIRDKKQNRQSLASIKIGEIIEFERGGVTIRAEKMAPAYQFKTPWFKVVGEFEYVHKTEIKDWRIVADNAATPTETPQISTETAETVNVSADGENAAETKEMPQILNCEPHTIADLKEIPNISKLAKAGIIINGVSWHTEYLDQTHNVLARVDNLGWHEDGKGFGDFQGSGVFGKTAIFESWDNAVITMIDALTDYLRTRSTEPPHSPKTPQTVNVPPNFANSLRRRKNAY
jgi:hypothetical protein